MKASKNDIEKAVDRLIELTEDMNWEDMRSYKFKRTHIDALKHLQLTFASNEYISGQVQKRNESK